MFILSDYRIIYFTKNLMLIMLVSAKTLLIKEYTKLTNKMNSTRMHILSSLRTTQVNIHHNCNKLRMAK